MGIPQKPQMNFQNQKAMGDLDCIQGFQPNLNYQKDGNRDQQQQQQMWPPVIGMNSGPQQPQTYAAGITLWMMGPSPNNPNLT